MHSKLRLLFTFRDELADEIINLIQLRSWSRMWASENSAHQHRETTCRERKNPKQGSRAVIYCSKLVKACSRADGRVDYRISFALCIYTILWLRRKNTIEKPRLTCFLFNQAFRHCVCLAQNSFDSSIVLLVILDSPVIHGCSLFSQNLQK